MSRPIKQSVTLRSSFVPFNNVNSICSNNPGEGATNGLSSRFAVLRDFKNLMLSEISYKNDLKIHIIADKNINAFILNEKFLW